MDSCLQSSVFLQNKAMSLLSRRLFWLCSPSSESHPLFCAFIAAGIIVFLYFPNRLLSPFSALFSSLSLLLIFAIFHYGPPQLRLINRLSANFCELSLELESGGVSVEIISDDSTKEEGVAGGFAGLERFCHSVSKRESEELPAPEVDWESLECRRFQWDEEEEEEDLIEINIEEDNLFELDISAYG
ncbi:hypothetical protein KSP39_PZI009299 [Platanthera zijinensis]|uniref:Uncharacterized protein n=1 Tax=Platanthera zijinensis TaxID=2320716 RepID=A0AAP0BMJ0_9ASPA